MKARVGFLLIFQLCITYTIGILMNGARPDFPGFNIKRLPFLGWCMQNFCADALNDEILKL